MKPQPQHIEPYSQSPRPAGLVLVGAAGEGVAEPLKCVWSGYPHYNRDCGSRVPTSVVEKAWQREMRLQGTVEGFFYFDWRNGVWVGYGLWDGGVKGVYCPTHCTEREAREVGAQDQRTDQPAGAALQ